MTDYTSADSGASEVESSLLDGGVDDEHNGVGFVEIYKTSRVQDAFFFRTETFDRLCQSSQGSGTPMFGYDLLNGSTL